MTTAASLTPILAVNAGGPAVPNATVRGQTVEFQSNTSAGAGAGFTTTGPFTAYSNSQSTSYDFPNTDLDQVHAYERTSGSPSPWGYSVPVANGEYLIDLIYSEIFHGFVNGTDPDDARLFDVTIEGTQVENDYDIIDAAGDAGVEVIESYQASVTDGTLDIEFTLQEDQAKLSGFVIWNIGDEPVNSAPSISLTDVVTSLSENADVSSGLKVAGIAVSDDGLGTNTLSLSGADSSLFEILQGNEGPELWLVSGAALDSSTNPVLDVSVSVDDTTVGASPDDSAALAISIGEAAEPTNALSAFAAQDDLDTGQSYGSGAVGAAILEVMPGNNDIDASNYGANSFQVTNIGDKKISAIFIDVSTALYPDTVFDPDGAGGDNVTKNWAVNSAGGTGGYVDGTGYFLPGTDPIPNTTGTGVASNGGFKGAMVKFNPSVSGGFQSGETVGFSGDMDPNSIAGLLKSGPNGVDTNSFPSWDVGGISGHEMIGSTFTVLFDDGTTSSGQLASDGSDSGAQTLASQAVGSASVGLMINGIAQGNLGTYSDAQPTVIVTGAPGETVRITLTKGINPVGNTA